MKKWKIILYITGVLWIAAISQIVVNKLFMNENRIMEAFIKCDANVYESSLDIVVDYGKEVMTVKQKRQLLSGIAGEIGIKDGYSISDETEQDADTLSLVKKDGALNAKLEFISVSPEASESIKVANHFIVANVSVNNNFESILSYKSKLEKTLRNRGVKDYQTSVTLRGGLDGKLSDEEKADKVKELLNELQARQVNSIKSEDLYTVYAYTGLVDNYVKVSGYRININIVVSYDETKDETEIYLATPVLNTSY